MVLHGVSALQIALVEYHYCMKTGGQMQFSEQELVDCSTAYGNKGCDGGWYDYSWRYIQDNAGIARELVYPYAGTVSFRIIHNCIISTYRPTYACRWLLPALATSSCGYFQCWLLPVMATSRYSYILPVLTYFPLE